MNQVTCLLFIHLNAHSYSFSSSNELILLLLVSLLSKLLLSWQNSCLLYRYCCSTTYNVWSRNFTDELFSFYASYQMYRTHTFFSRICRRVVYHCIKEKKRSKYSNNSPPWIREGRRRLWHFYYKQSKVQDLTNNKSITNMTKLLSLNPGQQSS